MGIVFCLYTFAISAQNNTTNKAFGTSASTTVSTTYLPVKQTFDSISFNASPFTNTNAAAVNENGEVVLASATQFDGYYVCNMNDLKAVKMEGSDTKYNSSDFANGNL